MTAFLIPYIRVLAITIVLLCPHTAYTASPNQSSPSLVNNSLQRMLNDINKGSHRIFVGMIDFETIVDKALKGLEINPKFAQSFRRGMLSDKTKNNVGQSFVDKFANGGRVDLIRSRSNGKLNKSLIRLQFGNDGGFGYMELHVLLKNKQAVITEWYDYGLGLHYSTALRQIVALSASKASIIGRVFDIVTDQRKLAKDVMNVLTMYKNKQFDKVKTTYSGMGRKHKRIRIFMVLMTQIASASGDDDFYNKVLNDLAQYHGDDPKLTFLLLDFYYTNGQFDKYIDSLDGFIHEIGINDEALISLKAQGHIDKKEFDTAIAMLSKIVKSKSDFEHAYWVLLNAYVLSRDYKSAIKICDQLQTQFDYILNKDVFSVDPMFNAFIESKAFSKWMAKK